MIAGPWAPTAQPVGKGLGEFAAPAPNRLVGDLDTALGQEQFDIAEAERERVVQPNGVRDQLGWEAVAVMGIGLASHPATMPSAPPARQPRSLCDDAPMIPLLRACLPYPQSKNQRLILPVVGSRRLDATPVKERNSSAGLASILEITSHS